MKHKTFFLVSGAIFAAVALLHVLRLAFKWEAVIGGWAMPMWVSVVACVIAATLATMLWREHRS